MAAPAVRLLGPVNVFHGGSEHGVGGSRPATVLAALAISVGRAVATERLIDAVWDDPPATVSNTLQVYVSGLRKLLRQAGLDVQRTSGGYVLAATLDDVDAELFQRHATEGRAALRAGDVVIAAEVLESAWALWSPTPLAGLADTQFVAALRAALTTTAQQVAVDLGTAWCALDRAAEACALAEHIVELFPFDEAGWDLLMRSHYFAGRARAALDAYRRARATFVEELGLDPSPALADLERQILGHAVPPAVILDATPVAPAEAFEAEVAPRALPAPTTDVIGRQDEIERVLTLLGGGVRLVSLVGLGGMGKTTTALAVGRRLVAAGASVVFADLVGLTDAHAAAIRICEAIGATTDDCDPWAAMASLDRALLVIADNCEQIDELAGAIAGLVSTTSELQVLATTRRPLQIRAEHVVPIQPLGVGDDRGYGDAEKLFVARVVQNGRAPRDLGTTVTELCALAGGIPLAIEVAARFAARIGGRALLDRLRAGRMSLLDEAGATDVPDRQHTLRVVLDAAMASVGDDARTLGSIMAAIGGPVSVEMLDGIAGGELDVRGSLADLVDLGIVAEEADGRRVRLPVPVTEYLSAFTHSRAGTMVLDGVIVCAESLAGSVDADGHWGEAALTGDSAAISAACEVVVSSGDLGRGARLARALRRHWLLASTSHEGERFCRALMALEPDGADRVDLLLLIGQLAARTREQESVALLRAGIAEAEQGLADPSILVHSLCYLGSRLCDSGEFDEAHDIADGVGELTSDGDAELVELGLSFRSYIAHRCGDFATAATIGLAALEDVRRSGDRYLLADALSRISETLLELDRLDEAERLIEEAVEVARTTVIGPLTAPMFQIRAAIELCRGRVAAAAGWANGALRFTLVHSPDPVWESAAYALHAAVWYDAGDHELAARCLGAADAVATRSTGANAGSGAIGRLADRIGHLRADPHLQVVARVAALEPSAVGGELLNLRLPP